MNNECKLSICYKKYCVGEQNLLILQFVNAKILSCDKK